MSNLYCIKDFPELTLNVIKEQFADRIFCEYFSRSSLV